MAFPILASMWQKLKSLPLVVLRYFFFYMIPGMYGPQMYQFVQGVQRFQCPPATQSLMNQAKMLAYVYSTLMFLIGSLCWATTDFVEESLPSIQETQDLERAFTYSQKQGAGGDEKSQPQIIENEEDSIPPTPPSTHSVRPWAIPHKWPALTLIATAALNIHIGRVCSQFLSSATIDLTTIIGTAECLTFAAYMVLSGSAELLRMTAGLEVGYRVGYKKTIKTLWRRRSKLERMEVVALIAGISACVPWLMWASRVFEKDRAC